MRHVGQIDLVGVGCSERGRVVLFSLCSFDRAYRACHRTCRSLRADVTRYDHGAGPRAEATFEGEAVAFIPYQLAHTTRRSYR